MKLWPFERKNLPTQGGIAFVSSGGGWVRAKNYIEEGYQLNVVVYRAVREISDACANLTLELHSGDTILETHPVLELLAQPNPMQGYDNFIKNAFIDFLLTGEMAIYSPNDGKPGELWPISPIEIDVKPGPNRIPSAYLHKVNGRELTIPVDRMTGRSQLFFHKMYNPASYWRGQAPLMAAALAADTHNAGLKWNYKLLKNSARPSGILKFEGDPSNETINRLREFFKRQVQGEENAGEIPMLTGGANWVATDTNPKDMDFLNTMKEVAKLVASAYGVPLPLIDNDASTFNNVEQAKERLYTDTIIPLFNDFLSSFGAWLLPLYGDNLSFKIDMDDIPALESVRQRKYDRAIKAKQAGVLTADEARIEMGYDPVGGAAAILDPLGSFIGPEAKTLDMAALAYGTKAAD